MSSAVPVSLLLPLLFLASSYASAQSSSMAQELRELISSPSSLPSQISATEMTADAKLYTETVRLAAPSIRRLAEIALSTEIDSVRFMAFLDEESRTLRPLVRAMQSVTSVKPPELDCRLVFGKPGVVSKVSTVKLEEINLQGRPNAWLKKLDQLQCEMCLRAKAAALPEGSVRGLDEYRALILNYMIAKEFERATFVERK
jgi:hypothetical protein